MPLHGRYTNGTANVQRVTVTFRRKDLLWKTAATLTAPGGTPCVEGLPIRRGGDAVGPTILDMMVREIVPLTDELRDELGLPADAEEIPCWTRRPIDTLWLSQAERPSKKQAGERVLLLDHPFQRGLASGGRVGQEDDEFVEVEKTSTVSISEMALKLAVGMAGNVGDAYTRIGALAAQRWSADLARARKLWARIQEAGELYEDGTVVELRPLSSVSQEIELMILRQACTWLGVDPDQDCSRPRGRPRDSGVESGKVIRIRVSADGLLSGELLVDFNGLNAGTQLNDLLARESVLVELLGALRVDQYEFDVDLLEAFLDASAPDWRERAAARADDPGQVSGRYDPYEVLGVSSDATLDDVTRAYKRAMQRVHPDVSSLGPWFAQVVSAAYRSIRQERGEQA